jgi:hypothetical protein
MEKSVPVYALDNSKQNEFVLLNVTRNPFSCLTHTFFISNHCTKGIFYAPDISVAYCNHHQCAKPIKTSKILKDRNLEKKGIRIVKYLHVCTPSRTGMFNITRCSETAFYILTFYVPVLYKHFNVSNFSNTLQLLIVG